MAKGGKKDARYITEMIQDKVEMVDKNGQCTDIFYFDGAGNVQKAGLILCQHFPRAYTLHGGEHVIALFFHDLANLAPIKVCYAKALHLSNKLTLFHLKGSHSKGL